MKGVGTVLHVAGSGRLIVGLTAPVSEGSILYDSKRRRVARVREIIGPVRAPYASAEPMSSNMRRYLGATVGIVEARKR